MNSRNRGETCRRRTLGAHHYHKARVDLAEEYEPNGKILTDHLEALEAKEE